MKRIIILGLFLFILSQLFAQNQSDPIEVKKVFLGTRFRQNGKNLKVQQLMDITRINEEAYKEMKIARNNYNAAIAFTIAGGIFAGIPFQIAFTKHAKSAVEIYNEGIKYGNYKSQNNSSLLSNNAKHSADLLSGLYYTSADSSYQKYIDRIQSLLQQDKKVISYKLYEYKYGKGKIKSRGLKAKHTYGINEDFNYTIGTWEYYTKGGEVEKTINYNLNGVIVK